MHANTFPDRIVPRHDEKARATRTGPMMTMIMPSRKISERIEDQTRDILRVIGRLGEAL